MIISIYTFIRILLNKVTVFCRKSQKNIDSITLITDSSTAHLSSFQHGHIIRIFNYIAYQYALVDEVSP